MKAYCCCTPFLGLVAMGWDWTKFFGFFDDDQSTSTPANSSPLFPLVDDIDLLQDSMTDACCSMLLLTSCLSHDFLAATATTILLNESLCNLVQWSKWSSTCTLVSPPLFFAAWCVSLVELQAATMPQWRHSFFALLVTGSTVFFILSQSQIDSRSELSVVLVVAVTVRVSTVLTDDMINECWILLACYPCFFCDCHVAHRSQLWSLCCFPARPTHPEFSAVVLQHSGLPLRLKLVTIRREFLE